MANQNTSTPSMSESIEMYLVRVAQLQRHGQPVPLSQLAQELSITSVSANEMCRKLTEKGLVEYEPYKGVTLTPDGDTLAQRVLRSRHLWETFFVEKLGFEPTEADEIACRFEHVTPDDLADRLAAFLGTPKLSSKNYGRQACLLANLTAGKRGRVIELTADNVTKDFLKQQGIALGETVMVLGVAADGTLLLEVSGQPMTLSQLVAQTVKVTPESEQSSTAKEATMTTDIKQITLDQLPLGEQGVVVRIGGEKSTKRRLLDMGMVPGETVTIKKVAPLGDPLELEVKNYQLSLRKNEASNIIVEVA
jgi:DtxR family Mn-dependent transcriptional regulator